MRNVCEIGLETDKSIKMWEEFFPNARIFGIDIDEKCRELGGNRRRIFIGNQSDTVFLNRCIAEIGCNIDIVIDDGSHIPAHQIKTFNTLFPVLSSHGIYVIEDTGGCVGDFDLVTLNYFKEIANSIMYWPKGLDPANWSFLAKFPKEATWLDRNVGGVAFYRWLIFIMRGRNPEDNPYLRSALPVDHVRPNADGSMPDWMMDGTSDPTVPGR